ncbi:MAG TPA: winged helix-turn-helix domain-containing protein [Gemmatimonadaceae bacterium]|jgi:DNA-binding transcriptional ArsR family regulator
MAASEFPTVEVAVTPRFDLFYALYALTSGGPSRVDAWKEKARRRLPDDFERSARRVAPLPIFWPLLADATQSVAGPIQFDKMLSIMRALPPDELQRNVLSGVFHDRATVDSLVAGKRNLKAVLGDEDLAGAALLEYFGLRPFDQSSASVKAINSLITEPQSFRDELTLVLRRFWQSGFDRDWTALEPRLRADAGRVNDLQETARLPDLGRELNLPLAFDDRAREARPKAGAPLRYDEIEHCYLLPSAFNERRWWAKYSTTRGRATLYIPIVRQSGLANSLVEDARPAGPVSRRSAETVNAESVFRALGDTTRYAIASILARAPTTSAELARSLNVSKPTITHHVQALRAAGLVSEQPDGGSTRLSLREDTVAALSEAAVRQLFTSGGDLTLATTRKRRRE